MRAQGEILHRPRLFAANVCRTNVLRSTACIRVEERILVCEVVESAFRNDLQNRQRLMAQNANRQFATRNEFLHQQFAVVFQRLANRRIHLAFVPHD